MISPETERGIESNKVDFPKNLLEQNHNLNTNKITKRHTLVKLTSE